ncbi:hypothetical protein FOB84_15155 [Gordonia bronchialis]|nr:hypothetical protein FOB84_15155 [Gordonia bronchialis]
MYPQPDHAPEERVGRCRRRRDRGRRVHRVVTICR